MKIRSVVLDKVVNRQNTDKHWVKHNLTWKQIKVCSVYGVILI